MGTADTLASHPTWLYFIVSSALAVLAAVVILCIYHVRKGNLKMRKPALRSRPAIKLEDTGGSVEKQVPQGIQTEEQYNEVFRQETLKESATQFYLGLVISIAGFIVIIIAIVLAFFGNDMEALLGTMPGIVVNIVSALFFKQSKDAKDLAVKLYQQDEFMANLQNVMFIADRIQDQKIKSTVLAALALYLAYPDEKPAAEIQAFIKGGGDNAQLQQDQTGQADQASQTDQTNQQQ